MADQATQPSWLQRAMTFVALAALVAGHGWMTKQQPAVPVVIAQPVEQVKVEPAKPPKIDDAQSFATKDGITLSSDETKAVNSVVRLGVGQYVVTSYPVGSKPLVFRVLVASGSELLSPVTPPQPGPDTQPVEPVVPTPSKPTAAIYFYEKDQTAIPPYVSAGLNQINRKGIDATLFEVDTKAGSGQIPERFRVPHSEAVKAGVPVLIVMSGTTVSKVIKAPKSLEEITGAVQ